MPAKSSRVSAPRLKAPREYAVEFRSFEQITPYENNPKVHTPTAVAKLARIIGPPNEPAMGQLVPIVVDQQGVIAKGHRTRLAMLQLGYAGAWVHVAKYASEAQLRQWRLDDNRLSEDSAWDQNLQRVELTALRDLGVDLITSSAFEAKELERIFGGASSRPGLVDKSGDQYLCVVTCKDETDLQAVYEEMQSRGYACKLVT